MGQYQRLGVNMEDFFDEVIISTNWLFELFRSNNYDECKSLIEEEKNFYNDLNFLALDTLLYIVDNLEKKQKINEDENFELAMYNEKQTMLIRRINNMSLQYYDRCQEVFLPIQTIQVEDNKYIKMRNTEGALNELGRKILTSIEVKFLYLLLVNDQISDTKKSLIMFNMMFINPVLQDKIFNKQIILESYVKDEDVLYNSLWNKVKEIHDIELGNYCFNFSKELMRVMVSDYDIDNEENVLVRETYLRALFNYLGEETLEQLNYEYNSGEYKIVNQFGDKCVRDAFKSINKDTEMINKIKVK